MRDILTSENKQLFGRRFKQWSIVHPRQWTVASDRTGIIGFISNQIDRIVKNQIEAANNIVVSQERMADELDRVAIGVERVGEGLDDLAAMFEWGFSELVWQLEEQRKILQEILRVLQAPLDTQARELRRRAEYSYKNGWFDDAVEDFTESERKNRYDFTIHQNLGNIYLFEEKNPTKALEYYEKAAKYATPRSSYHASIAFLHIGLIEYLQGNFQRACEATLKAMERSPYLYEAHYQHAQYCANLGRHDEAIKHLKKAIEGDRYYCIKADSEKDFDSMKAQLEFLFEELREKASDWARKEVKEAEESIQIAVSYGVSDESTEVAKKKLNEADALIRRNSYFDYLDAFNKAKNASKLAAESSVQFLTNKISRITEEYGQVAQKCRERIESVTGAIVIIGTFSFALLPIFPILLTVYTYFNTHNWQATMVVFIISYLVGTAITAASSWETTQDYLYERHSRRINESYETKLALLENQLSDAKNRRARLVRKKLMI